MAQIRAKRREKQYFIAPLAEKKMLHLAHTIWVSSNHKINGIMFH